MRGGSSLIFLFVFCLSSFAWGADTPNIKARPVSASEPKSSNPLSDSSPAPAKPIKAPPPELNKESTKNTVDEIAKGQSEIDGLKTQAPGSAAALQQASTECQQELERARSACLESQSPELGKALQGLMSALGGLQGASGGADACAQTQQANEQGQQDVQKYNEACKTAQAMCEQKCSSGASTAQTTSTATCLSEAQGNPTAMQQCTKVAGSTKQKLDQGLKSCQSLKQNLGGGMEAVAGLLKNLMAASQCKEQLTQVNCADPMNAMKPECKLDCNKAENMSNPTCICMLDPRAAGCGGNSAEGGITDPVNDDSFSSEDGPTSAGVDNNGGPSDITPSSIESSGGGAPGAFGGGGGGLKGGGAEQGGGAAKGLNTNVLSGDYGGGGGASGGGGGGDPYGKYAAHLPKVGGRGLAGKEAAKVQVSGSFGTNNWQKINQWYQQNARGATLLPRK